MRKLICLLRGIYYKIFIMLLSLRRTLFAYNLAEEVKYNGELYWLLNGETVILTGEVEPRKRWKLCRVGSDKSEVISVFEEGLKKYWNIKNLLSTYVSRYNFYMSNWYRIWVNNGIPEWCKKCNIW